MLAVSGMRHCIVGKFCSKFHNPTGSVVSVGGSTGASTDIVR